MPLFNTLLEGTYTRLITWLLQILLKVHCLVHNGWLLKRLLLVCLQTNLVGLLPRNDSQIFHAHFMLIFMLKLDVWPPKIIVKMDHARIRHTQITRWGPVVNNDVSTLLWTECYRHLAGVSLIKCLPVPVRISTCHRVTGVCYTSVAESDTTEVTRLSCCILVENNTTSTA